MSVKFRPVVDEDIQLIYEWLHAPHVMQWWRDDNSMDAVKAEYSPSNDSEDRTQRFIVVADGEDIGYIQKYWLSDWPEWAQVNSAAVPDQDGVVGIDYLLGEKSAVGRGVGTAMIGAFVRELFADEVVSGVISDPQADNIASRRILENNGFSLLWTGHIESDDPSDFGLTAIYFIDRNEFTESTIGE